MGKAPGWIYRGRVHGHCVACQHKFIGPGDRCPPCREKLRQRKRRKPR